MNERAVTAESLDQQVAKFRKEIETIKGKLSLDNELSHEVQTIALNEEEQKKAARFLTIKTCDDFLAVLTQLEEDIRKTSDNPNEHVKVLYKGVEACLHFHRQLWVHFQQQLDLTLAQDPALHEKAKSTLDICEELFLGLALLLLAYTLIALMVSGAIGLSLLDLLVVAVSKEALSEALSYALWTSLGLGVGCITSAVIHGTLSRIPRTIPCEPDRALSIVPPDGLGFFASERLQALTATNSFELELNRESAKQFTELGQNSSQRTSTIASP